MADVQIKNALPRVRMLREALKYTKAEAARRAQLTPSQYSWFEPAKGDRRGRVFYVPQQWVERVAIALGTTTDYIASGKIDDDARIAQVFLEDKYNGR